MAHMRWNLALVLGLDAAEAFRDRFQRLVPEPADDQHYWDLVTALDVLSDLALHNQPGICELERLEQYVEDMLEKV